MIYFDNAATTFPKPKAVYATMEKVMRNCANPGRSGHKMALESGRMIYKTRELLAKLFRIQNPMQIIFTYNATDSLNLAIKGVVKKGDHVITTSMEHNSVLRPLQSLKEKGMIQVSIIKADREGHISIQDIEKNIQNNTKMIITTHASNVIGTLLPIEKIGKIAQKYHLIYMVDAAQSAGVYQIDVDKMNIDLLVFPGHKALLGPQGTGGLYIREGLDLEPFREGGTGSQSESLIQPQIMPDRYESGTLNTIGIAGLGAGINFILSEKMEKIQKHEEMLTQRMIDGLMQIEGVSIYGPKDAKKQASVVSINIGKRDSSEISFLLDQKYDIASRSGLHCAPLAHKTIGTFEQGTVRFSMGYFNTIEEVDQVLYAIEEISEKNR
ncbi:aminotransferase class V-fold PLP-dependent enzyme [Garciella nitratireducens]|uniref:aminotransferase class V-fold PLP-dependent enzyme n=1 Tax=Garciella nitratireducens TaxID=218205 RepID=UPI000DEB68A2|nr:aminotransferase class V-fold PLP-dependent enzyme [Garciella nitratireducens]RBP36680.1 cysteine desulfurase family protein [Garciella nitratireducens]